MFAEIIIIILILLIIFTYLLYLLFKKEPFKKMIILSSSIFIFFIITFNGMINILGYPVVSKLPDRFDLLFVKVINKNIIILVKDVNIDKYPRLHILNHSISLEDEFKKASYDLKDGKKVIGIIDENISDNHYGIIFKPIKRNIPTK